LCSIIALTARFPSSTKLSAQISAINFYLSHRDEIDACLAQGESDFEKMRRAAREANPLRYRKLEAAKKQTLAD